MIKPNEEIQSEAWKKAKLEYFKNNPHMRGHKIHWPETLEGLKQLNEADKKASKRMLT